MHKPVSIQENERLKILWNFEIKTNHLIPERILDQVIFNKKKKKDLAV